MRYIVTNTSNQNYYFLVIQAIVLQLEGKKKWKLYKPIEELSREHSADLTADEIGEATHEIELEV